MTKQNITYININDPVSATVANKPLSQLNRKTDRLQDQFEATAAGNTLIYRDIPCLETVQVGMPVYWDGEAQLCKPAYVTAELNETTNEYQTGKPADCIGLVYKKSSAYSADLLISGLVDFPELSNYLDGGTGRFYLGTTPGSLSLTPNVQAFPLGVALGTLGPCDTAYRVYLNPCYTNNVLAHQHYSVDLKAGNWDQVMVEDENAPNNATYIYNIEQDEELSKLWPPIPIGAVSATIDWAETYDGGREQTINKETSLISVNEYGIYWMGSTDPSTYYVNSKFRITIHFSKVQYSNRNSFVTSLQPDTNQPFKFVNCKGQEASSGELYAQFTLNQDIIESTDYNGKTLQEFTEDWKSKMVSTVNGLSVGGNAVATSTGTSFTHDGVEYKTGAIKLDISPYAPNTELAPQIIKVGAAQEREIYGVTYLGLPAGRASSLKLKFEVPANYSAGSISFKLRMQCIAAIEGTYASATVKYYKVARATTPQDLENLEQGEQTIACNFAQTVTPHTMFEVESSVITVNAGDTVIVVISRSGESSYNADLAIARIQGIMNIVGASNVG